jgi:XTP/dITP diphosphohydrolase/tetrapyrrole methylase family protein/MazG family protein
MSKIYEHEFLPGDEIVEAFIDFYAIVGQLRRDCPWDREQTHESVKHLMIEEVYEAVEAIDDKNWDELQKELGDVLLHVLFHSDIAQSSGRFSLLEVLQRETSKLVRRHPHVFGDVEVTGVEEVLTNWEQIKKQEGRRSTLEGVPRHLPALLRAYRMQ